jgi:UDP-galactopyranose mutase
VHALVARRPAVSAHNDVPGLGTNLSWPAIRTLMAARPDIVCFSHLRWDGVFQRPQHLMSRFGRRGRVFYFEEPLLLGSEARPRLEVSSRPGGIHVAQPHLASGLKRGAADAAQARMLGALLNEFGVRHYVLWYYTPLAARFTRALSPAAVVYDCMDELRAFKGAPPDLAECEQVLLQRASLVFTGGQSLYEAKRYRHSAVYPFPSSVDAEHFRKACSSETTEPQDQAVLSRPRLGFFGVLDERLDLALLDHVAAARPDWQLVMIGPVAKISPSDLPRRPNIHYLGPRPYAELPAYLSGWDVALMPFARNESTRFISPTKTPEYLAAGCPVVSTPIRDVVRPYGEKGVVRIAETAAAFVEQLDAAIAFDRGDSVRSRAVDALLKDKSWDRTWEAMDELLQDSLDRQAPRGAPLWLRALSGLASARRVS